MPELGNPALDRLFTADRIAVIGASATRPDATGNQILRMIRKLSTGTLVVPVSPTATEIEGFAAVPSIEALPAIDVAVVAVAAHRVVDVLEGLEAASCPIAVVVSVGISTADLESLRRIHERGVTAVHGPNCMGVIDVHRGLHLWADEGNLEVIRPGSIALVSQSGSGAIFVVRSLDQAGFSRVISSGNEAGLTTADYVSWLADDPATTTIGLVVESIPDGAAFSAAIQRAHAAGKRVIALKVGRTPQGALATVAHTGALVSDDDAYAALFRRLGVPLVDDYDELATSLQLASLAGHARPARARVGALTISGGQAALTADLAQRIGVETPAFAPETIARLRALDPETAASNPFDAGAGAYGGEDDFPQAIRVISEDPGIDIVMVILDGQTTLTDTELGFEDEYFAAADVDIDVPLLIVSSSSMSVHPQRLEEFRSGRPLVRGIANALIAVRSLTTVAEPVTTSRPADLPDESAVAALRSRLAQRSGPLETTEAAALLLQYGLPITQSITTTDVSEALGWAGTHGYPCVLKIASPDIPHRSEIGGVVLDVRDAEHLQSAWNDILANVRAAAPGAAIEGIEIQPHLAGRLEAYLGFVSDERLGATVGVGMGGVLVELIEDTARGAAPLDQSAARALVASTRLGRLLGGFRALHPATDTGRLADAIVRLSWLAHDYSGILVEADLNPVLIEPGTGRASIVDALLVAGAGNPDASLDADDPALLTNTVTEEMQEAAR